ncbi:MAG: hypothetical protein IPN82_14825 [Chitinophagaceae bacterium]|nr:hypothetical protein [Chitinophagaceae bacterium]MBP6476207.1 hypothetical protein [Chitinophagaceae bacterium]MBP7108032.1 hypothetical protein [Chitinophagaceae bacterium]MBP7313822.1 hypothetical protein [Chitinophagaceae bacterium]HQV54052.1 hypothetical protein [Chitinophagaceae bacterium]
MKKSVFFVLIMAIAVSLSSQVIKETVPVVKPDYLQKSKRQSTIAYATGIPGCLLFSVGGIMSMSQFAAGFGGGPPYDASKVRTGDALMIAGGGLLLIGFPFQLAARKNKKRAMTMSIKTEAIQQFQKERFLTSRVPSLALKISL